VPTTHDSPLNISVYFPGGRLFENEKNCGITYLMLKMIQYREISESDNFDTNWGVSIENHADFFGFSLNSTAENFTTALKQLFRLVTKPIEDKDLLNDAKVESRMEIQKVKRDPLRRPVELFYQSLFAGHSYAFSRFGSPNSIEAITFEQIQEWHQELVHIDQLLITIAGDGSPEKIFEEIFEVFGMIPVKTRSKRATVLPLIPFKRFEPRVEDTKQARTSIVVGHKGVDAKDHRYYDLEIMRHWLAGSRGQLHLSLREKLSVAQTVNAYNVSLLRGGAFFLHATTHPEHEAKLTQYITAFFSSLGKLVISQETYENAKFQAVAMFSHGLRNNDGLSYYIASQHMAGKPVEGVDEYKSRIENAQLSRTSAALSEIFAEDAYAIGMVRGTHE
jgi:zinc protease